MKRIVRFTVIWVVSIALFAAIINLAENMNLSPEEKKLISIGLILGLSAVSSWWGYNLKKYIRRKR